MSSSLSSKTPLESCLLSWTHATKKVLSSHPELLVRFDTSLRVLAQNRGVGEVRVARDKLIVILETLEFFREQVSPAEQQDVMAVCRACFRELSVSMAVLERAFVGGLDGSRLHKVLKELILKMDNALMDIKKKNIDLISFGAEDIKREVSGFFRDYVNGTIL